MNAVGIDVSKGKSAVAAMRPFGEVVLSPYEVSHTNEDLHDLAAKFKSLPGETRVVMEYTGCYHAPVTQVLCKAGILGLSDQLEYAYQLKNDFQELLRAPDSSAGRALLSRWVLLAETAKLPEFSACTTAVHNWYEQILNSLDVPYSNGYTEGCNNRSKVLKRVCFGVRNFRRFRNRILHCAA